MAAMLSYRRLDQLRSVSQVLALLLLFAIPLLNWLGVHWLTGTLYSMSVGPVDIADPAMAAQTVLLTRDLYAPLLIAAVIPIVLALLFGRVFCSWACPFNTFAEWILRVQRRFFRARWLRAARRPVPANPRPRLYWGVLAGLFLIVALTGAPLLGLLSAPGIISSQISHAVLGVGVGAELALVGGLLVVEAAVGRRLWCKYACPVGATLSLFRTPRTLRVLNDTARCACRAGAEACRVACPLGLLPRNADMQPYCFNCGSCIAACEKTRRNSLSFSFGGKETT